MVYPLFLCRVRTSAHAEARQCSTSNSVAQKEGQNFSHLALFACVSHGRIVPSSVFFYSSCSFHLMRKQSYCCEMIPRPFMLCCCKANICCRCCASTRSAS